MAKLFTYKELVELSKRGELPEWKNVSGEQISKLYVDENISKGQIADLFNVSDNKVSAKRDTYGIKMMDNKKMISMDGVMKKLDELFIKGKISKITYYKILFVMSNNIFSCDNFDKYDAKNAQINMEKFTNYYSEYISEVSAFIWKYMHETKYASDSMHAILNRE